MQTTKQCTSWRRRLAAVAVLGASALVVACWWMGGQLVAPQPAVIPAPPDDFPAREVTLPLTGGEVVKGWWLPGAAQAPSVLLLHGVRANRLAMLNRARLLAINGYSVLLIDLPAHGESSARAITLGVNESRGVVAARDWLRVQRPSAKIGVIGVSLGGASVLLGPQPCGFDAVVLEAVYPDIHHAILDRLRLRIGPLAPLAAPLLEWQLHPRLGIEPSRLRPVDHIAELGAPVLLIAGGQDQHTRIDESLAMFARALPPKELWVLPNAAHVDFERHDQTGYDAHVLSFLRQNLRASDARLRSDATRASPTIRPRLEMD